MRTSRSGMLAIMVAAVSVVALQGTVLADTAGSHLGPAAESNSGANKPNVDPHSKDTIDQGTNGQHSGMTEQGNGQSKEKMQRSETQQGKQEEKASQADLSQGKTAKAVEEIEQQKAQ